MSRYHIELWNGWTSEWEPESEHPTMDEALLASDPLVASQWRIIDAVTGEIREECNPIAEEAEVEFARLEASRRWNENRIQREQSRAIRQRLDRIAARQRRNLRGNMTLHIEEEKVDWAREGF